jgi:hypothetical protein
LCIPKFTSHRLGIRLGIHFKMDLPEALWSPMALKPPYLLDFRHKKRRPWTSLDDEVVGRGNLNPFVKILIYNINIDFYF